MPPNDLVKEGGVLLDIYTDLGKVKAAVRHLVTSATTPENAIVFLRQLDLAQPVYAVDEDPEDPNFWNVLIITGRESPMLVIRCYKGPQSQTYGGTA